MFADDIIALAESPGSLQLMINRLFEYCNKWRLQVNLAKSKIMVFRNGGGRNCRNESWKFGDQNIEVVKEYNYLGIRISRNLNLKNHMIDKLAKSKSALNATWRSVMQCKDVEYEAKYRIFRTTAEAIMCYAAQVWGHKQFEEVEQLLRYFLKRTLRLPNSTANHILMLETGLSPLFTSTLKMQIDYILKTIEMEDSRLPKKITMLVIRKKTSWFESWRSLAEYCGISLSLQVERMETWKSELYRLISLVDERKREEYIEKARSSTHRSIYAHLNYNLAANNYFRAEYSTDLMALILKARGELLPLNFLPHRSDLRETCELCNLGVKEDVFHFLGRCPILVETRRSTFAKSYLSDAEMINTLNGVTDWDILYQYIKIALSYRKRIFDELF